MRLVWLTCACLLVLACDRGPMPPASPSGPTHTPAPVAAEAIRETPAELSHEIEAPAVAPEPEPEPELPDAIEPTVANEEMPTDSARDATEIPETSELTGECCRTCRKGKACGDTCVARDRECTVAPGCACDA
jgi:hypothetical protein